MVIANSTWVRPAQALIYSESGEMKLFPPRNRGSLPRALTFGDQQDWRHNGSDQDQIIACSNHEMLSSLQYTEDADFSVEPASFLINSESENFHMEDPPEEYNSFESEYFKHSVARDADAYMDVEVPCMSTPTEQYMNNVLKLKMFSRPSVFSPKQQQYLSSVSDTGCLSPLLQPADGPFLSLGDLVDLYSKKLEDARVARLAKENGEERGKLNNEQNEMDNASNGTDRKCHEGDSPNKCSSVSQNQSHGLCNMNCFDPTPLQLMTLDIQMLIEKLDDVCPDQPKNSSCEDWCCISSEEFHLLLMNCCKKTMDVVMIE